MRHRQAFTQGPQCMPDQEELDWAGTLPEQREARVDTETLMASQACNAVCLAVLTHDRKQLQPSLRIPTPSPSQ